jgi:hypothetical protein
VTVKLFESPALAFALLVSVSAPSCSNTGEVITAQEREVARIAAQVVAVRYPKFDAVKHPPIVVDKGSVWFVAYQLPENSFGGTPEVVIEKGTLKILSVIHTR